MTVSQAREEREVCPINAVWSSRKWTGVKQRLDNSITHLIYSHSALVQFAVRR